MFSNVKIPHNVIKMLQIEFFFFIEKLDSKTLLEWKYVSERFHWNVLFLLGAGFSSALACKV